jgi:hypothetical protein
MGRRERMEEAQQKLGRVDGPETALQKEDRSEIQGRARRTSGREKTDGEKDYEAKVESALKLSRQAGCVRGDYFPVVVDNLSGIAAPHKNCTRFFESLDFFIHHQKYFIGSALSRGDQANTHIDDIQSVDHKGEHRV